MKKIFVTSIGTNIGKTLFTCALAQALKAEGQAVNILKPVISGFNFNKTPNDISQICNTLEIPYTKDNIKNLTLYSFVKALSPDMAARAEKKLPISLQKLTMFCTKKTLANYVLIEGAGGVMSPINRTQTMLDVIQKTSDEVILVAGSYLGSLSHTITAYKTLADNFKKPVLLVISQNLNKSDELYVPVLETIKSLEKFVASPIIGLEKIAGAEESKINKLAKILIDAKIFRIIGR